MLALLAHHVDNRPVLSGVELSIVHLRAPVPLERLAEGLRRHEGFVHIDGVAHQGSAAR